MSASNFNKPGSDDLSSLIYKTSITVEISTSNQQNVSYKTNKCSKNDRSSMNQEQLGKSLPLNAFYRRQSSKFGLDLVNLGVRKPSISTNKNASTSRMDYGFDSRIEPKISIAEEPPKKDTSRCSKASEVEKRLNYSCSVELEVKLRVGMANDIEPEKEEYVMSDRGIIARDHSITVEINSSQALSSDGEFKPKYSRTKRYPIITEITEDEDDWRSQEMSKCVILQPTPPDGLVYLPEELESRAIDINDPEILSSISEHEELPTHVEVRDLEEHMNESESRLLENGKDSASLALGDEDDRLANGLNAKETSLPQEKFVDLGHVLSEGYDEPEDVCKSIYMDVASREEKNIFFTYPNAPDMGHSVLGDRIPPEIYPRRLSLRELEDQIHKDMLQSNKHETRDEKLDVLEPKQPTEETSDPVENLLDDFSFVYPKDEAYDADKRQAKISLEKCSPFIDSFEAEDIETLSSADDIVCPEDYKRLQKFIDIWKSQCPPSKTTTYEPSVGLGNIQCDVAFKEMMHVENIKDKAEEDARETTPALTLVPASSFQEFTEDYSQYHAPEQYIYSDNIAYGMKEVFVLYPGSEGYFLVASRFENMATLINDALPPSAFNENADDDITSNENEMP